VVATYSPHGFDLVGTSKWRRDWNVPISDGEMAEALGFVESILAPGTLQDVEDQLLRLWALTAGDGQARRDQIRMWSYELRSEPIAALEAAVNDWVRGEAHKHAFWPGFAEVHSLIAVKAARARSFLAELRKPWPMLPAEGGST